jgi:flagellar basal-body rod modification protein FlgD
MIPAGFTWSYETPTKAEQRQRVRDIASKGGFMTTPVPSVSNQNSGSAPVASSAGMASLLDPTTFLTLLVDELKYQNPLDPTSSSDFMSQIAQLSQVEQLQSVSSASQMGEAAGLIGRTVTANEAGGNISGVVTGVTNGTSGPLLNVGNSTVALSDVEKIGDGSSSS